MKRQSAERASRWNDRAPPPAARSGRRRTRNERKRKIFRRVPWRPRGVCGREGRGGVLQAQVLPPVCLSVCLSPVCPSVCLSVHLSASLASVRVSALPPIQRGEASHPDDKNRKKTSLSLSPSSCLSFSLALSFPVFLSLFRSLSL